MNVIVIMEDSLRKDHLGCYGNMWIKTPYLDHFAQESVIFDHAYAEGLPTIPVRTALFTGRYTLPFRGWQPLEQNDVLISEILWDKGITSALISDTWHMHKPQMGFSRGFSCVRWIRGQEGDPAVLDPNVRVDPNKFSEKNWHPTYPGQPAYIVKRQFEQYLRNSAHWKGEEDHHIAQVVKAGIHWLDDTVSDGKMDNLFLWLDCFDPHEPWDPPSYYVEMYPVPEYDGLPIIWGGGFVKDWTLTEVRHIRSQYAGTITLVDKWTGLFLEKVEELGLFENTMIIFFSDHGEPFGEHGIIKKVKPWPYEELCHIPLIIRLPDATQRNKGQHAKIFTGMPDIMPTILEFLNVKGPAVIQGKSLLPVMQGERVTDREFGISGYFSNYWSIRNRQWSFYSLGKENKSNIGKRELYKFNPYYVPPEPNKYEPMKDQPERENILIEEYEIANSLEKEMLSFLGRLDPSPGDLLAKDFMKRDRAYNIAKEYV